MKKQQQVDQLQERREQFEKMKNWHEGLKILQDEIDNEIKEY
jgi:hypothetical protein